jgi:predicted xylose isomerase-like sugar epimerase
LEERQLLLVLDFFHHHLEPETLAELEHAAHDGIGALVLAEAVACSRWTRSPRTNAAKDLGILFA